MAWLDSQINEGVKSGMLSGFIKAAYERCDGKEDPEDRCPSSGVCVCAWVHYSNLPWWKRLFIKDPPKQPTTNQASSLAIWFIVDEVVEDMISEGKIKRKPVEGK